MANISKNINNSKNKTKLENIRISTTTALREKIVNIDENDLYDDEDEDLDYQELPEYEDRDEDDDPFDFDDDDPLNKDYSTKEEENENDFVLSRRNKVIFRIFWDCEINNYKILSLFDETVESYKINLDRKEVLTNWLDEFDKKELELIIKGGINYTSRFLKILSKKIKATDEKNKQYFETYAGAFSSFFIQFEDGLVLTADLVLVSEKGRDIDEYRDFNSDYHKAILLYLSYLLYYCNKKESNLLNKRFDRKEFGRFIDASKKIIKEEFPKGIDEKIFNIYNNYKDCIKESCNTNTEYLLDVWLKERPNEKNKNYLKDILRDLKKSFNESENKESFEKKLTEIYDKLFLLEKDKKNYNNKQINPFNFIKNRNAIVLEKLKKSIENNKTKDKDEILNNSLIYGIDKRKITINKFDFGFIKTDYLPSYLINLTIEKEEENFETSIYYPIFQTDGDLSAVYLINGALYYLPFFRIINQNEEIKYYNGYDFFRLWYDKIYNNFEKLKNSYDKDSYEFKIYLIKKFLFGWDKVKWQKPLRYIGNFTSICAIDSLRSVINTYIEKDITISGGKISFYKFVSDTSNPNTRIYPYKGKVDFGIDPINTPENESIRVTGRLSYNCFLEEEKIRLKDEDFLPMSRDTLQIPYKGWTEPRRLLLGANLLAKAISLNNNETPLCNPISHFKNISIPDGHNLLTLFMTYSGLNHEDAWVISESASRKYYTEETKLHIIPISNFLIEYHILVKVGEKVKRGDKLCEGFYRDIFLSRRSKNEKKYVRMNYPGNFSSIEGEVTDIQIINTMNFERDGILSGFYIPMYYKEIVVVSIKKKKPLRIGDKLANRHGHKGIIGKIIPDEEMPTVIIDGEEKSAEALIDPISVLNRDNWGQLLECYHSLLTKKEAISGYEDISKDKLLNLMKENFKSLELRVKNNDCEYFIIGGYQFIFRLPQCADEKNSGSPGSKYIHVYKPQKLGELDNWALFGHNLLPDAVLGYPENKKKEINKLNHFLAFLSSNEFKKTKLYKGKIKINQPINDYSDFLELYNSENIPKQIKKEIFEKEILQKLTNDNDKNFLLTYYEYKDHKEEKNKFYILNSNLDSAIKYELFNKLKMAKYTFRFDADDLYQWLEERTDNENNFGHINGLHIIPFKYLTDMKNPDGSVFENSIKKLYRKYFREIKKKEDYQNVSNLIKKIKYQIKKSAIGSNDSLSKKSFFRNKLQSTRITPSLRAVIAPGINLGLDEVGIPTIALLTLFRDDIMDKGLFSEIEQLYQSHDSPNDKIINEINNILKDKRVFVKRDPVLHKFGFLCFKPVWIENENVIRLPASVLGPMGADFDGDQAVIFKVKDNFEALKASPVNYLYHDIKKEILFKPGKQFLTGLYLILQKKESFQDCIDYLGINIDSNYEIISKQDSSVDSFIDGLYRYLLNDKNIISDVIKKLEYYSSDFIAKSNPGMNLSLESSKLELSPALKYGSKKKNDDLQKEDFKKIYDRGASLEGYYIDKDFDDPINTIMADSKANIGNFGGLLRRLVFKAKELSPNLISQIQTITEFATQKSLDIKKGKKGLDFKELDKLFKKNNKTDENNVSKVLFGKDFAECSEDEHKLVKILYETIKEIINYFEDDKINNILEKPFILSDDKNESGEYEIRLNDIRLFLREKDF